MDSGPGDVIAVQFDLTDVHAGPRGQILVREWFGPALRRHLINLMRAFTDRGRPPAGRNVTVALVMI